MPVDPGAGRKWTYEDLLRLPEDGKRHEIIDGAHFVMPSPIRRHQAVLGRLYLAFGNFLAARPEPPAIDSREVVPHVEDPGP